MHRSLPLLGLASLASATVSHAQSIEWTEFAREDARLSADPTLGTGDTQEKDFAFGDFDGDGWTDLISVRKQPFTTAGRRPNVLFMNEGGTLVDRTGQYASATDVSGDMGFLTPTNDRDVAVGDLDGDGWLDFVTATTLSAGQPKHVSHPRAYMNLGRDGNGDWLGFRYEEARTPDWGTFPNMCGIAIGDVTGDGAPDIYFSHYVQGVGADIDDRLLINDGNGFFVDESTARMTLDMRRSAFGTSAVIADMNGDDANDVISASGVGTGAGETRVSIAYNNPNSEGFFNILQEPYNGAPYHVNVGDLNQDGRLDMVVSDDGQDRFLLNQGNDPFGRVAWGPQLSFNTDDGFGSNNYIEDLDLDGWPEVIVCDVDVDFFGCDRRLHIYHNRGGVVGGTVVLHEERQGASIGALGLPSLQGVHDVAIFDIDNDGDKDLVVGRCTDTRVYINLLDGLGTYYCSPAVVNSSGQPGRIVVSGSPIVADNDVSLAAAGLPPNTFGFFLASQTAAANNMPGGSQGILCVGGSIGRYVGPGQILNSGTGGSFLLSIDTLALPQPTGSVAAMPGEIWRFTAWYRDSLLGASTSNFTDAFALRFR